MKWKVINYHPQGFTHKEMFRGDLITIKAGEWVEMDYEDAVQFKGQFYPIKLDAMEQPDPKFFKCIRIEPVEEKKEKPQEITISKQGNMFVCMADGKKFKTKEELEKHIKENFSDLIVVDPDLDKKA